MVTSCEFPTHFLHKLKVILQGQCTCIGHHGQQFVGWQCGRTQSLDSGFSPVLNFQLRNAQPLQRSDSKRVVLSAGGRGL